MKKEEFYFDSRDGENQIYAVRYMPDNEEVKGIVQIIHGVAEHIGRYEEFARFLTDRGMVVTGEDHLGHGKTLKKGDTPGYFCENDPATVIVRDVHRLKKMTQELYPGVPYIIFGHSMGSFMLRNYISRYGKGISGAIISGTGHYSNSAVNAGKALVAVRQKLKGPKYISKFLNNMVFYDNNKAFEPAQTPVDWFTKDASRTEAYVADPLCGFPFTLNGIETLFEVIGRMYEKEALEGIPKELPILFTSGAEDPIGENGKGVKAVYESYREAGIKSVEMTLFENDRHEILNETDREEVMNKIYDWIAGIVSA